MQVEEPTITDPASRRQWTLDVFLSTGATRFRTDHIDVDVGTH